MPRGDQRKDHPQKDVDQRQEPENEWQQIKQYKWELIIVRTKIWLLIACELESCSSITSKSAQLQQ